MNTAQADLGSTKASHPQIHSFCHDAAQFTALNAAKMVALHVLYDPEGNPVELWEPAGRDTPR